MPQLFKSVKDKDNKCCKWDQKCLITWAFKKLHTGFKKVPGTKAHSLVLGTHSVRKQDEKGEVKKKHGSHGHSKQVWKRDTGEDTIGFG